MDGFPVKQLWRPTSEQQPDGYIIVTIIFIKMSSGKKKKNQMKGGSI